MGEPISNVEKGQTSLKNILLQITSGKRSDRLLNLQVLAVTLLVTAGGAALNSTGWIRLLAFPLFGAAIVWLIVIFYNSSRVALIDYSKLKGASPFGIDDDLWGLDRDDELALARDRISLGDVSVIFVHGPAGAGKTSFVVSGLRSALAKKEGVAREFPYVDGGRTDFKASLLSAASSDLPAPKSVEEMMSSNGAKDQVVVIDNADLVPDQPQLMEWVRLALERTPNPSFKRSFVFVLDEEKYQEHWKEIDWPNSRASEDIYIPRFSRDKAIVVARALCDRAQLMLPDKLIGEIVAGSVMEPDALVSPLSLSVILQMIGGKGRRGFDINEYRASGYAAGMMAAYIRGQLSTFSPEHREAFFAALSSRAGEGMRTFGVSDLKVTDMSNSAVSRLLKRLSKPPVHILGSNQAESRFKILDEWLLPLDASPDPERIFLEDYINKKYEWWRHDRGGKGSLVGRLGEGKYLLTRYELRQFEGGQSPLRLGNDPSASEYFSRSKTHRRWQVVSAALLALVIGSASVFGYSLLKSKQAQKLDQKLEMGWGLPDDFATYGRQLTDLSAACMVDNLGVLPRNLTSLDASCWRIESLKGVPPNLTHLRITDTGITTLDFLPAGIKTLDIHGTGVKDIKKLSGYKLSALDARGIPIEDMGLIPRTVTDLKLQYGGIKSLMGLPGGLTHLEFIGTQVKSLVDLPDTITDLRIANNDLIADKLPNQLVLLEIGGLSNALATPSSLDEIHFTTYGPLGSVDFIPTQIKKLEFRNSLVSVSLPARLESLKFFDLASKIPLAKIPRNVSHLKVQLVPGEAFPSLPQGLVELDISGSDVALLAGIPKVATLNISDTKALDLRDVPDSVTSLTFQNCRKDVVGLAKFPAKLQVLDLSGCSKLGGIENIPDTVTSVNLSGTAISALTGIRKKLKLVSLDISNTNIRHRLPELPSNLEELTLHLGQIDTMKGLPKSVKKLRFTQFMPVKK
jgi:Leucine-rich repeat (LRR) protein